MKLLLDENIPAEYKKKLTKIGHDVEHVNQKCKGLKDNEIFEYSVRNKRCIITYDFDYNELKKLKHYGIIKIDQICEDHFDKLVKILEKYNEQIEDIFIRICKGRIYKEIKKYSKKKGKFKQFQRIDIDI